MVGWSLPTKRRSNFLRGVLISFMASVEGARQICEMKSCGRLLSL